MTPQQSKIKKISAEAKKIYNSKGNKLSWIECIKKASKKVK